MVKKWIVFFVLLGLSLASAVLWLNNLTRTLAWRQGDKTPSGFIPDLDWAAIDLTTIATFIPLYGFLLAVIGVLRTMRPHSGRADTEFPFYRGYLFMTGTLGVVGTLLGVWIVMRSNNVSEGTMERLLEAFGGLDTAVWSSIVALVWLISGHPLLAKLLQMLWDEDAANLEDEVELLESVNLLSAAASQWRDQLKQNELAVVSLTTSLTACIGKIGTAADKLAGCLNSIQIVGEICQDLQQSAKTQGDLQGKMIEVVQELSDALPRQMQAHRETLQCAEQLASRLNHRDDRRVRKLQKQLVAARRALSDDGPLTAAADPIQGASS